MAKRLNFPVGNKELEVATWDDILAANEELIDLKGLDCVGGVDYAKTNDFVACSLVFRVGKKYYVIHHTFVCMKSRDLPGIKAPLKEWANMGHLTFVNDVEISAEYVTSWFYEMGSKYNILKIGIDNFRYSLLNSEFKKIGFDAFEKKNIRLIRPNDIMKVAPIINSVFINKNFAWGTVSENGINPIMCWYTNNTKKVERNGNITYEKIEPNYRKTDGFMALVNAMVLSDEIKDKPVMPRIRTIKIR